MKYLKPLLFLGLSIIHFSHLTLANAAGKKSPVSGETCSVGEVGSNPIRGIAVANVTALPFQLPNGSTVTLTQDLRSMLITAMTQNSLLREITEIRKLNSCDQYLELKASVTALTMDANQFRVKFGFSSGGALPISNSVNVETKVNVGSLAMDFAVRLCQGVKCIVLAAAMADQTLAEMSLNFSLDLSRITTGGELLFQSNLSKIIRKVMEKGIQKLNQNSNFSSIPWAATVTSTIPGTDLMVINAGLDENIKEGDVFDIFALTQGIFSCDVSQMVGSVITTRVFANSSEAQILVTHDRGIQAGDRVLIGRKVKK